MKVIENVTLYQCDFCKKDYKRKHFAIKHEPTCRKNPENKSRCFDGCRFLEQKEMNYLEEMEVFGENYGISYDHVDRKINAMWCNSKKIWVYPFWCNNPIISEDIEDEVENEVMPNECDLFKPHNIYHEN